MKRQYLLWLTVFSTISLVLSTSVATFSDGGWKDTREVKQVWSANTIEPIKWFLPFVDNGRLIPESLTWPGLDKIRPPSERNRSPLHVYPHLRGYQAPNPDHGFDVNFNHQGVEVRPSNGGKAWRLGLRFSGYGYGADIHAPSGKAELISEGNRIEYHHGDLVEWYVNDHRGLEQGFTMKKRPPGRMGSGLLQICLNITGNLEHEVEKDGKGILWRDDKGNPILKYNGLYAYDAAGRVLGCRMTANQKRVRLIVASHGAVYPITIDPLFQRKKVTASDGEFWDRFGYSVSISNDTAIVGADFDSDKGEKSGSVYIFQRNNMGADNWGEVKKLTASDGTDIDYFGHSVSISEDTIIVGAYYDDDKGGGSGSAYIFSRHQGGANNWGEVKKLTASDGMAWARFGYSVSISGDTAIVGAYTDDAKGEATGSAYIFSRHQGGVDNWGEVKKLTASDATDIDYFGYSVSISEDTAVIGARYDDVGGGGSGSAYIFSRHHGGADNWGEVKKLTASDGAAGDSFGANVSISGDTAIVGAMWSDGPDANSGAAYIFSRDYGGAGNWGEVKKLTAHDRAYGDYFGGSVSINGDTAIIGVRNDDDKGYESGSAYLFSRDHGGAGNWGKIKKLTALDGATWDWFGWSVSMSGDTAIVGAYRDDENGSAFIFEKLAQGIFFPIKLKSDKSAIIFLE